MRILNREEIDKLIAACSDTYQPFDPDGHLHRDASRRTLGADVGLDVDFQKQSIRVRAQLSRETGGRKELKTKSKARRTVHLFPSLVQMLREHKARSPFSKDSGLRVYDGER
jgi:hypothetical protein